MRVYQVLMRELDAVWPENGICQAENPSSVFALRQNALWQSNTHQCKAIARGKKAEKRMEEKERSNQKTGLTHTSRPGEGGYWMDRTQRKKEGKTNAGLAKLYLLPKSKLLKMALKIYIYKILHLFSVFAWVAHLHGKGSVNKGLVKVKGWMQNQSHLSMWGTAALVWVCKDHCRPLPRSY